MRGLVHAAALSLVGTILVVGPSWQAAAEDDSPGLNKKMQDFMVQLGIRPPPDIDYQERSPLVLPPRIDLPPPQANPAAAAPNWPVDPDVKRRQLEQDRRRDEVEESRPLRPDELNVGRRTRDTSPGPTQDQMDGRPSRPSELGYTGGLLNSLMGKKEPPVQFTSEPPRTSLIEPPPGYQTPSPSQPYTAKGESYMPKIPTFWDFGSDQSR